jgi:protein-S-isoprenylcysteine O-methyltransferase Ste14
MAGELVYRLLVFALLATFIVHRGYYTRRFGRPAADTLVARKGGRMAQAAGLLGGAALLASLIYILAPQWLAWASLGLPAWLRWLGVGVALAGFGLLQWAHVALGRNWSDTPRLLRGQALVVAGPYAWVRHPMYTAFLLILGSTLLISANWLVGGLWLAGSGLDIAGRVRFEEAVLAKTFGAAYREHALRTGRLLPRVGMRAAPERRPPAA